MSNTARTKHFGQLSPTRRRTDCRGGGGIENERKKLTVDKGIFELWSAPDTALVLLGVFVSLSVAVLFEVGPEVERVDVLSAFAGLTRLVTRCLQPRVEDVDGL